MTWLSHLSPEPRTLPQPADPRLLTLGLTAWQEALDAAAADPMSAPARAWSVSPEGRRLLAALFGNSPFLTGVTVKEWAFLTRLVAAGPDALFAETLSTVEQRQHHGEDRAGLQRRLRIAKRRVALVAAVAELAGDWPLERQTAALSRFAAAALGAAARHLLREAAARGQLELEEPDNPERHSGLIILGMGKLGGEELNYSSDIDLILLYDPGRARVTAADAIQAFFVRLARDLVRIFDERTGDGYVFRTDLRLRPDPGSTPLAMSVPAALAYYESVGQNWERAAMIKARAVAGDIEAGRRFLADLQPFIWRRHLDFAAIQDIHSIKRQIDAHRGAGRIAVMGHDIKIGRGGIREIEFFAQTQQLIWGGRMPQLRVAPTCEALRRLAGARRIDAATAERLTADYRFLRRLEHRLQMIEDAQTHRLPGDAAGIAHIACFLGYPDAERFTADLLAHLTSVERHYAELFEEAPSLAGPGNLVFTGIEDDPETLATLKGIGFAEPGQVAGLLRGWHHGRMRATRSQRAREILTELAPELLRIFGATPHPDLALLRFDRFLSRLPAGVQLFSLFHANPGLLQLVADVMAGAPRLAEQLAERPGLLDAVLSEGFFGSAPQRADLAAELAPIVAATGHFEEMLDALRRWAAERRFQVGVQLLRGGLDGIAAGAALANIAEVAVAALVPAVEADFAVQHGRVPGGALAVIGMGRLGSREMTLASDLDLILVYDASDDSEQSDGRRPLPTPAYYARLSQRLISAIAAPTAAGMFYAVDMRLRPSGEAGPIATSLAAFDRYQRESAWTWEHMALTRARPVAGDPALGARAQAVIDAVLCQPRDPAGLVVDVAEMRRRIAEHVPHPSLFDLKNRTGGLTDLEFLVQYLVLRHTPVAHARLPRGTAAALAALAADRALPEAAAHDLTAALQLLRHVQALLTLIADQVPDVSGLGEADRATLARLAGFADFARLDRELDTATTRVRVWYEQIVAGPAHTRSPASGSGSGRG